MDPKSVQRKAASKHRCFCPKCGGPGGNGKEIPYSTYRRHQNKLLASHHGQHEGSSTGTLPNYLARADSLNISQSPSLAENLVGRSTMNEGLSNDMEDVNMEHNSDEEMDVDKQGPPPVDSN